MFLYKQSEPSTLTYLGEVISVNTLLAKNEVITAITYRDQSGQVKTVTFDDNDNSYLVFHEPQTSEPEEPVKRE